MTLRKSVCEYCIINGTAIALLSFVYAIWLMPAGLASVVLMAGHAIWFFRSRHLIYQKVIESIRVTKADALGLGLASVAICFDIIIIASAMMARTEDAIVSPWQRIPLYCLLAYGFSWLYALSAWRRLRGVHGWILAVIQCITAYSLIALVYALGFGFDVFVHEATVSYISSHGFIAPKQFIYIGAYIAVLPFYEFFKIPFQYSFAWFLPVIGSIALPTTVCALWPSKERSYWFLALILFAPLTFTVPFNISVLIFGLVALLSFRRDRLTSVAAIVLGVTGMCVHPLAGFPALVLGFCSVLKNRISRIVQIAISFIATVSGLLIMLWYYTVSRGGQVLIPSLATVWDSTKIIFRSPALYSFEHPWLSALYIVYALWPHVLFLVGLIWLWRNNTKWSGTLLGCASGLVFAAIISASSFRYRDIISYEQYEFSYRLVSLLPWLVFPGLVEFGSFVDRWYPGRVFRAGRSMVLALMLVSVWYVSYPQYHAVMPYNASGVSRQELDVVDWMEEVSKGSSYVALAPQFVSATALREFGFERSIHTPEGNQYPYPIPTGGTLYAIYGHLLSGEGEGIDASLNEAFVFSGTNLALVVIPRIWMPDDSLEKALRLKSESDSVIGDYAVFAIRKR